MNMPSRPRREFEIGDIIKTGGRMGILATSIDEYSHVISIRGQSGLVPATAGDMTKVMDFDDPDYPDTDEAWQALELKAAGTAA